MPSAAIAPRAPHVPSVVASATAPAVAPAPVQVSFELAHGATSSTLWLLVSGRPKQKLRAVPAPFTCDMTDETPGKMDHCSWSIACKVGEAHICVRREQGGVTLLSPAERPEDWELARVRPTAQQPVQMGGLIHTGLAQEPCPVDAPPVVIDAKLTLRKAAGEERTSWFELPQLGVGFEPLGIISPTACDSERARGRLQAYCMSAESSWNFTATVKGGVMRFRSSSNSYDGDMTSSLGAVQLPCGAQIKWPRFRLRDRAWSAVGIGQCGQACRERRGDCDDRCRTRYPAEYHDDGTAATDQGADCLAECELTAKTACHCGQFQ